MRPSWCRSPSTASIFFDLNPTMLKAHQPRHCEFTCLAAAALFALATTSLAQDLKPGVRGLATRAPANMKIDGDLAEFRGAFCTPVNYFHPQPNERAAQFFYMWDDEAFYAGLRTLDTKIGR